VNVWERYNGPYSDEVRELVEFMLHKCRRTGSSAEPGTGKRAEVIGVSGSAEGR
jgi:hypothetical protein